ncbi:MAG: hypothetical protein KME28_19935 [Pelatocladus maniniholoensis HA4357-MV3]|jgi:hypothetical protein|uniref:Uncharacterized protein n=1 Tax=Pelatocladus maniniholoensis HA4357-MV3 TaxID=1117104 RepID=A0A9E3LUA3_9NOST|nr:hypothetical protein [Pelatocladus maniniholoensis HA4357-MV3]BAZ68720.1 hypothetical protein NIES4106_34860 [Fischerella sp. NIES-4106]
MNNNSIYQTLEKKSELTIETIVNRILTSGEMSRQDYALLTSHVFTNDEMDERGRRQINRVFDYIQTGRLRLVHW